MSTTKKLYSPAEKVKAVSGTLLQQLQSRCNIKLTGFLPKPPKV
jgi:hypothetical protein